MKYLKTEKARNGFVFFILFLIIEILWGLSAHLGEFLLLNAGLIVFMGFCWCAVQVGKWIARGE